MSEIKNNAEGIIIAKDIIDFLDRNDFNSIVRTKQGLEFIQPKTEKQKPNYSTEELLKKALQYISDEHAENRCGRALIKRALEEL